MRKYWLSAWMRVAPSGALTDWLGPMAVMRPPLINYRLAGKDAFPIHRHDHHVFKSDNLGGSQSSQAEQQGDDTE